MRAMSIILANIQVSTISGQSVQLT